MKGKPALTTQVRGARQIFQWVTVETDPDRSVERTEKIVVRVAAIDWVSPTTGQFGCGTRIWTCATTRETAVILQALRLSTPLRNEL